MLLTNGEIWTATTETYPAQVIDIWKFEGAGMTFAMIAADLQLMLLRS